MKMPFGAGLPALAMMMTLWGAAGAAGAQPETFRCHQPGGGISFQQSPCPVSELAPPDGVPAAPVPQPARPLVARPAPTPPTPPTQAVAPAKPVTAATAPIRRGLVDPSQEDGFIKPTRRKREVLELSAQFERCRADAPGFAEKSAVVYAAWTRRHAAVLTEYDKLLAAKIRAGRRGEITLPLRNCTEEWLAGIEPLSRMPDPRFGSVEKTWQVFMGALMTGDRLAALSCFAGKAETRWKERVDRMSDDDLRSVAASIRALKVQWGDDYEKEGVIADTANRVVGVGFRNLNEEWKITEFGSSASALPVH
jgi:hypothetical protein